MLTIKKILFPTDFSQAATDALLQALYLAEQYKAELHFFHVMDPFDDPNNPSHR
ncbi:MAG TPA: universal stress protein, partial [Bacteroidota bacterium]